MRDPTMAAATLVGAQADAMKAAAANEGGAMSGFMGMGMAANAGGLNAQNLFAMGQQPQAQPAANGWKCSCGATATGKFCPECGSPKPADDGSWTCACGAKNMGKFCPNCGGKKPAGIPQYKCDKCGWQPEDPTKAPRFCPECGDPFDNGDII
jgi:membrane protease subunit (stomatin/prohibitin family)